MTDSKYYNELKQIFPTSEDASCMASAIADNTRLLGPEPQVTAVMPDKNDPSVWPSVTLTGKGAAVRIDKTTAEYDYPGMNTTTRADEITIARQLNSFRPCLDKMWKLSN